METKTYLGIKEAIRAVIKEDKDYILVRHSFVTGEKARPHYHEKANEWVIIDNGDFTITMGDEEKSFSLKGEPLVIFLPACQRHSLSAESEISYFVIRDAQDKTSY